MKLVKSLLLGSAAGIAAMAGAQAADLPVRKAAPVDYVRVCSTYGTGYFFIPGSDTCLRISGYVQADYLYLDQEGGRNDFDDLGFRGRARINIDARQPTEYGLLRAFMRWDVRRQTGTFVSGGEGGGGAANSLQLPDQAYIQFGGLTAGRSQSFFDFYTFPDVFTAQGAASDTKTQLLAYTMTFGGGLSATLSLEDQVERRNFSTFGTLAPAGFVAPPAAFLAGVNNFSQGGFEYPDIVGNVRIDQAWGAAQLSGAIHQVNPTNLFVGPGGVVAQSDDEVGFAVSAGVMFKLPFLAPGDELWLQATYADGAGNYAGFASGNNTFTAVRNRNTDAFVDAFGNVQTAEVFSVAGKFLHYWQPNLRSNFFAGYSDIDYDAGGSVFLASTTVGAPGAFVGFVDNKFWEVGANLIWTPVKQLDIGVEAVYRNFESSGNIVNATTFGPAFTPVAGRVIGDDDVIEARLRIQRDF
jgi:hypothetical protein